MTQYQTALPAAPKSVGTAYILYFFLGLFGGHQFYMGKVGRGLSMLLTLGWLGVGLLVDLFTMEGQVTAVNRKAGIKVTYSPA